MTETATAAAPATVRTPPKSRPASKVQRADIGIPSNNPAYIFADEIVSLVLKPRFHKAIEALRVAGQATTLKNITAYINGHYNADVTEGAVRRFMASCGIVLRQQPTVVIAEPVAVVAPSLTAPLAGVANFTSVVGEAPVFGRPPAQAPILSPEEQVRQDLINRNQGGNTFEG